MSALAEEKATTEVTLLTTCAECFLEGGGWCISVYNVGKVKSLITAFLLTDLKNIPPHLF